MNGRARVPARAPAAALVALAALAGCGDEAPAPGVQRLLDHFGRARVTSAWNPEALRAELPEHGLPPQLAASFEESLPESARVYLRPRPLGVSPGGAVPGFPAAAPPERCADAAFQGGAGLRFPSPSGLVVWVVPLLPDTPYVFSFAARRGLEVADHARSTDVAAGFASNAWVGGGFVIELRELPQLPSGNDEPVWQMLEEAIERQRVSMHAVDPPPVRGAYARREVIFRSSVYSGAAVLALCAGNPGWWCAPEAKDPVPLPPAGTVDFDEVRLTQLPVSRYLAFSDRSVQDDLRPAVSQPGAHPAVRELKLLGEVRRAALCVPPAEFRIPLQLPGGRFRLTLGYGLLEEFRPGWAEAPVEFRAVLRLPDGSEPLPGLARALAPRKDLADYGWQDFVLRGDLPAGPAELVLTARAAAPGADVAAFAEPCLMPLPAGTGAAPWNVVLISIDTLRADHLGCYGHERPDGLPVSPRLDAFAREALVFEEARTVAPFTLPSHATLLTGLYPQTHGVLHFERRLVEGIHPLLAVRLAGAGYATAAFTGGGFLSYEYGFHLGFERYSIVDPMLAAQDPLRNHFPRPRDRAFNDAAYARHDLDSVEAWVKSHGDAPFFLFLHTFLVHNYHADPEREARFVAHDPVGFLESTRELHPLDLAWAAEGKGPPPEWQEVLRDAYDATISEADARIGRFLDFLREEDLWDRTIVVITSDHGEEFGEHQGLLHGRTVYEEVLRVPLLLRVPGRAPEVIREPVDLADVAPTVLDALGLSAPPGTEGASLLRRVAEEDFRDPLWAEVESPNLSQRYAVRSGDLKFVWNPDTAQEEPGYALRRPPARELYDLAVDPGELHNLLAVDPEDPRGALGMQRLQAFLDARRTARDELVGDPDRLRGELSPAAAEMLRALGYATDHDAPR